MSSDIRYEASFELVPGFWVEAGDEANWSNVGDCAFLSKRYRMFIFDDDHPDSGPLGSCS